MHLTRLPSVEAFTRRVSDFLLAREAEHNLLLGIAATLQTRPEIYDAPPYLAAVEDHGKVIAVALRTPPHNLLLSETVDDAAVDVLAEDARRAYATLPGVLGPVRRSRIFAERWRQLSGQPFRRGMAQRIYQLNAVTPLPTVPGALRRATLDDLALAVEWYGAFSAEAEVAMDPARIERNVRARLTAAESGLAFWVVDGRPVSIAGHGGPTRHGIRIGPVYTPPAERRRGYASACTAALSQQLLDGGRRFCYLFTDLANPTANHIYQEIGYRAVADVDEYRFDAVGAEGIS